MALRRDSSEVYPQFVQCAKSGLDPAQLIARRHDFCAPVQSCCCQPPTSFLTPIESKMDLEHSDPCDSSSETSVHQGIEELDFTLQSSDERCCSCQSSSRASEILPQPHVLLSLDLLSPSPYRSYFHIVPADTAMLSNAARLVTQIAALSLRFAAKHPITPIVASPSFDVYAHCCQICKKTTLPALALNVARAEQEDRASCPHRMMPNPSDAIEALNMGTFEPDMHATILQILTLLQTGFRIRTTEVIQSVILFDRICQLHQMCFTFSSLFRNSLKTLFLACLLVVHKSNADLPFRNACWAEKFGLPLYTLDQFELTVLDMLGWSIGVTRREYRSFRNALIGSLVDERTRQARPLTESGRMAERGGEDEIEDFDNEELLKGRRVGER